MARRPRIVIPAARRLVILALAVPVCLWSAAREFVVSPSGRDDAPGTAEQPFATPERALQAVRDLRLTETDPGPVTVSLRGGTYALKRALTFGPADSGTARSPVTYRSYPGERAVLSGGRRLPGPWQPVPGKPYWQTAVPPTDRGPWVFNSLSVNGLSRQRARTPNWGEKVFRAAGRAPGEDERQAFAYLPGDLDPNWTNRHDADLVLLCSWTPTIHRIREVIADRRVVRFFSAHSRPVDFWERNFRYYVVNVFEALDAPGEWYLNRTTSTLYYLPLPGEDLAAAEVIAPQLASRLIEFRGDPAAGCWVEHLRFQDLDLRHVDSDLERYNGMYRQGHMFLDAAVAAQGLRASSFTRCELAQLGEYAIELGAGCQDNRVEHCHLWDLGAGALQLGYTDLRALRPPRADAAVASELAAVATANNVIDNNLIHRLGTVWHGCYGIVNRFASFTRIRHNEIFDTHWVAIGLDARWNYAGEPYSRGNEVAYNHLHHLGLRYHADAAAVYQFGPLDTHIHHNRIHDTYAYPYICGYTGVYLDEQSRGALVENNLAYNLDWYAYFQHKGVGNVFRNNIGAFARDGFFLRGGLNAHWRTNTCEVYRNLYLARDAVAIKQSWEPGLVPPVLRDNMYFSVTAGTELTFAGKSFAEWQAAGQDAGSILADPGCRDPANLDFALRPEAPAQAAIGFVPFDHEIRQAGLYGDAAWVSLPERCERRTPTTVWTQQDLQRFLWFSLDFEDMPEGYEPPAFALAKEGEATFAVTAVAAAGGRKSLRCVDRKGLRKPFYPYVHVAPRHLDAGRVVYAFDAMLDAARPGAFYTEFRGRESTRQVGPSLRVDRAGTLMAGDRTLLTAVPGTWFHVDVRFKLGQGAARSYELRTRYDGREQTQVLPFVHETFAEIRWLGISACDDADGIFYLDNLEFRVE